MNTPIAYLSQAAAKRAARSCRLLRGVFLISGGQLALENLDQKSAAAAGGFQKAGVDPLSLALDQIKHGFHHPWRREHLSMVRNPLF